MHNEIFYTKKDIKKTKLALISDIHYHYPGYNIKFFLKIIKEVRENKPDYVCICGDILDNAMCSELSELENFLNELARICPVLVVTGNHDEKKGSMFQWSYHKNNELWHLLKRLKNVRLLEDKTFTKDNICFYGFSFSYEHYELEDESYASFCKEANELKTKLEEKNYNIVLFHSPKNIYRYIKENKNSNLNTCDLILSGHMHNGLLPYCISHFINKAFHTHRSLVSPEKTLFPPYAQGRIKEYKEGFVYEGVSKLSKSTGFFHYFNKIYSTHVQFITIKKQEN